MFGDNGLFKFRTDHASEEHFEANTLFPVLSADSLLKKLKCHWWLDQMEELVGLPDEHYQALYAALIHRFAEFVQLIPSMPGGRLGSLLSEGMARSFLVLQRVGQEHKDASPRYVYAVFSSALLLDIGKVSDYYQVVLSDKEGYFLENWMPYKGSMIGLGKYYKLRRYGGPAARLHQYATVLLMRQVVPDVAFFWLAEDRALFNMWLAMLNDDESGSGGLVLLLRLVKKEFDEKYGLRELLLTEKLELSSPSETQAGEAFLAWLQEGIANDTITVNQEDSQVFVVSNGIFVSIDLFRDFAGTASRYRDYVVVYKQFNHLGITKLSGQDYKYQQYFSQSPEVRAEGKKNTMFKKGFLSKPSLTMKPAPATVAKEGVLIKDPNYVFVESDVPSVARNAKAAVSIEFFEEMLPKLLKGRGMQFDREK